MDIPPIAQAIRKKIYLVSRTVPTCGYSRTVIENPQRAWVGRAGDPNAPPA